MNNFCRQLREQEQLSIKEVAQALGMTCQNYGQIEKNTTALSSKHLSILCKLFNCSVAEIFGENPVPNIDVVKLKFYNNHNLLLDLDNNKYTLLSITKEMLKFYRISNTFGIIGINAWEDNMKPIIFHDDFLLIDTNNKQITHKSIYALKEKSRINGDFIEQVKIKKILYDNPFNTNVVIKSLEETPGDFPAYELPIEEAEQMIIGKIIYCGKLIN